MTNKEIAKRLREICDWGEGRMRLFADELDPPKPETPKPEPGTVVWWRLKGEVAWEIGIAHCDGSEIIVRDDGSHVDTNQCEYKPVRVLADHEVVVKIPPTHTWGHRTTDVEIVLRYWDVQTNDHEERAHLITRAEAERMGAEG